MNGKNLESIENRLDSLSIDSDLTYLSYLNNDKDKYAILMEVDEEFDQSWYYFIKHNGNEENLKHLDEQLKKIEFELLPGYNTYDLDLNLVSAITAKEMTLINSREKNQTIPERQFRNRKFDGKLKRINLDLTKKDKNNKRIKKCTRALYGKIDTYIDMEDTIPMILPPMREEGREGKVRENKSVEKEDKNKEGSIYATCKNVQDRYVILTETNRDEPESWYFFINTRNNERYLRELKTQLESIPFRFIDELSIFSLDIENTVCAITAKEMTKVELNSVMLHRKFDGKMSKINFNINNDRNSIKIQKCNDLLHLGGIENFVEGEDVDIEDIDMEVDSSEEYSDFSGSSDSETINDKRKNHKFVPRNKKVIKEIPESLKAKYGRKR